MDHDIITTFLPFGVKMALDRWRDTHYYKDDNLELTGYVGWIKNDPVKINALRDHGWPIAYEETRVRIGPPSILSIASVEVLFSIMDGVTPDLLSITTNTDLPVDGLPVPHCMRGKPERTGRR